MGARDAIDRGEVNIGIRSFLLGTEKSGTTCPRSIGDMTVLCVEEIENDVEHSAWQTAFSSFATTFFLRT